MSLLDSLRSPARTFGRLPGDFATYSLNDAEGAVRLSRAAPVVAMDIETGSAASEKRWTIKAFSISDTAQAHVLDPEVHGAAIRDCIRSARSVVFHNGAYDVPILRRAGLMRDSDISKVSDTIITARIAWPDSIATPNRLGDVAGRALGGDYGHLKGALEAGFKLVNPRMSKAAMFDQLGVDSPAYVAYSAFDALLTARLHMALPGMLADRLNPGLPGFRPADAAYIDAREQAINRMLLRRSATGIMLDDAAADGVVAELEHEAAIHRATLVEHGLDPDEPITALKRGIVAVLDDAGELPDSWPRLKDGTRTTGKAWMERIEGHPVVASVLAMAQAERFVKDYRGGAASLSHEGRIHPQVSVQATVTGRMTYSNPNLQQYPPKVRRMFAFDRPITSFDWSAVEPVVIANLSRAGSMLADFEAGGDLYLPIAERAGCDRKTAKVVLLAMLYGQGAASLSLRLGTTEAGAKELQRSIRAAMPEVSTALRRMAGYGEAHGTVQTISDRAIPLPRDPKTGNARFKGYVAGNYVTQGSAYDLLAEALYRMDREGLGGAVCLAIHDEIVVHTEAAEDVRRIMEAPPQCLIDAAGRVPVLRVGRTDLGRNWEAKE